MCKKGSIVCGGSSKHRKSCEGFMWHTTLQFLDYVGKAVFTTIIELDKFQRPETQFYIQLVNRPHFGAEILRFGPFGQSGQ